MVKPKQSKGEATAKSKGGKDDSKASGTQEKKGGSAVKVSFPR